MGDKYYITDVSVFPEDPELIREHVTDGQGLFRSKELVEITRLKEGSDITQYALSSYGNIFSKRNESIYTQEGLDAVYFTDNNGTKKLSGITADELEELVMDIRSDKQVDKTEEAQIKAILNRARDESQDLDNIIQR